MSDDLDKNLKDLDYDLNKYSFDVKELSDEDKNEIKGLYTMLWKINSNKIFIENINKTNIRIKDDLIFVNNKKFSDKSVNKCSTLYFYNCKNITIMIHTKVCHITLENCEYVNIKTTGGSITGIDNINCKYCNHVIEQAPVHLLEMSKSIGSVFYISDNNVLNTLLSSYESPEMMIVITNSKTGNITKKFIPTFSFFDIYRLYNFEETNNFLQLYYLTPYKKKQLVKEVN